MAANKDLSRYDFGGRLKAEFPSQIIVDATEVCNLACVHCPHPDFRKSEHYSARYLDQALNTKLVDEVARDGKGFCTYLRYTSNGEPLVHPKIFDMLKYAKDKSGVTVALTTNGKTLREKQLEKLLATGTDVVDISLDAHTAETYAKIRVGGDYVSTHANVLRLIQRKKDTGHHIKIVVSYVEQPSNLHETKDFENYWRNAGADYVVVRRLHSAAGGRPEIAEKMNVANLGSERKPCVYPWERIVLGPRGMLAFCPADWTHGSTIVDFHGTTIKEIWQSDFYKKLREAHLKNEFGCHKFCGQCPDWKVINWPNEGRAYANMIEDFRREGADVVNP